MISGDVMKFYHKGMRELQDRYRGRSVADRLEEHRRREVFNGEDRACIENAPFFFLSTASAESVDCSFKGGAPGFVRITGENSLCWPDYDGNRMYRSLGNIRSNPRVGLLFIYFDGTRYNNAARLRINGLAEVDDSDDAQKLFVGAQRVIRVTAEHIFSNCPRYIPNLTFEEASPFIPVEGETPPEPAWKSMPFMKDLFEKD